MSPEYATSACVGATTPALQTGTAHANNKYMCDNTTMPWSLLSTNDPMNDSITEPSGGSSDNRSHSAPIIQLNAIAKHTLKKSA